MCVQALVFWIVGKEGKSLNYLLEKPFLTAALFPLGFLSVVLSFKRSTSEAIQSILGLVSHLQSKRGFSHQ